MQYVEELPDSTFVSADITKFEKQADGTVLVYGKATDDTLDIDKQIADPLWLSKAMPEWFQSAGNIRDMHQAVAAGKAVEYEQKGSEHFIKALVVDPTAAKKVEHGVYTGFSIGIRGARIVHDTKAAGGRIVDGQIVEVSLVDRPANPSAKFVMAKSVDGELTKVEETMEDVTDTPVESTEETHVDALASAKTLLAEIRKFDQASYEAAREALANLIVVEAQEMAQGEDEMDSIKELLDAVKHLNRWYEGEVEEGEVEGATPDPDMGDVSDAMDDLHDALDLAANADTAKSSDIIETVEETSEEPVEDGEVASLKAALEAAETKAAGLEARLSEALNKVAAGGPKRAARTSEKSLNDVQVQAALLLQKAAATTDPKLQQGYRERAEELLEELSPRKEQ